jgi:alkylhydroperoxidase family enzyme
VGRTQGVTEAQLRDLSCYRESDAFSVLEKLALDYAVGMTRTPVDVSPELVAELAKHLDEAQIVELTAQIAWENWRARVNRALGIEAHGFTEGAFCPIPEHAGAVGETRAAG